MTKEKLICKEVIFVFLLSVIIHLTGISNEISFDHLSVENGLSQNNALIVFQDSKGFIWIGTEDGLNFYDGYDCKIYRNDPNNPVSLSNNYVRTILEDTHGNIWIGTQRGINEYNWDKDSFSHMYFDPDDTNGIVNDGIQKLYFDSKGRLWRKQLQHMRAVLR